MVDLQAIPSAVPAGYMITTTYETRGTPSRVGLLARFDGSSDSTKDGLWIATGISSSADWHKYDEFITGLIEDDSVTTAKLATQPAKDISGLTSLASGDIFYYNGTNIIRLAKGADAEVLTLASGVPTWATAGGGSGFHLRARVEGITNGSVGGAASATSEIVEWTNEIYDPDSLINLAGSFAGRYNIDVDGDYTIKAGFVHTYIDAVTDFDMILKVNAVETHRINVTTKLFYDFTHWEVYLPSLNITDSIEITVGTDNVGGVLFNAGAGRNYYELWQH